MGERDLANVPSGDRGEINKARDRGQERTDNPPSDAVPRHFLPGGTAPTHMHKVRDDREHPEADRDADKYGVDGMSLDAGWCRHEVFSSHVKPPPR
jgi:hypothetical protein